MSQAFVHCKCGYRFELLLDKEQTIICPECKKVFGDYVFNPKKQSKEDYELRGKND